jgi:hypothetical protein
MSKSGAVELTTKNAVFPALRFCSGTPAAMPV